MSKEEHGKGQPHGMGMGRGHMQMTVQKPKKMLPTVKRLWGYLSKHKVMFILLVMMVIVASITTLLGTRMIGIAIDDFISKSDFQGLLKICMLLIAIYLMGTAASWLQMYISVVIAQQTVTEIRKELFDKMQILPLKFFDSKSHGELMSRITNDVDNIANALNSSLSQVISSFLSVFGALLFMVFISPILTITALITIPLMLLVTRFITKYSRVYFKERQVVLGEVNGMVEEIISGQKIVKIFVKEQDEIQRFKNLNGRLKEVGTMAEIYSGLMGPVTNVINNFSYMMVAAAGGVLAINRVISVGDIASFIMYSRQFGRPLNELANQYNSLLSAIAGAERVFEVFDEAQEPEDSQNAYQLKDAKGHVVFQDVCFSYVEGNPILKNISIEAEPGQTIALVGPTGAGKTTIINLLTRFYDIQSGIISIDGHNITDITRDSLRSSLGIVLQDTYLFTGSIKENIRYGRLDANDEEIKRAARLANAHEFIRRLPHGYDTILSEDADNISQGQKQMLAIARAILANPGILILDEATSNVDTRTEVKIQEAMLNLMKGRTSFVIAHRLSTIRKADMICVLKDGEIIERGTHEALLEAKGFYYGLYNSQFDDREVS